MSVSDSLRLARTIACLDDISVCTVLDDKEIEGLVRHGQPGT
jgi:hypothetical protein